MTACICLGIPKNIAAMRWPGTRRNFGNSLSNVYKTTSVLRPWRCSSVVRALDSYLHCRKTSRGREFNSRHRQFTSPIPANASFFFSSPYWSAKKTWSKRCPNEVRRLLKTLCAFMRTCLRRDFPEEVLGLSYGGGFPRTHPVLALCIYFIVRQDL